MLSATIQSDIRSVILGLLPGAKILLFGSRTTGKDHTDSDFDILVITKQDLSPKEKITWASRLHKALVYSLNAPVDILLNSEKEINTKKELPGHVIRWAMKEGVEI